MATVAEGVVSTHGGSHTAANASGLAKGIVDVGNNGRAGAVSLIIQPICVNRKKKPPGFPGGS